MAEVKGVTEGQSTIEMTSPLLSGLTPPGGMGGGITPTLGPVGPRGRARFDDLLARMRGMTYQKQYDRDYLQWIMSEKDDPTDPEFSQALAAEKITAKRYIDGEVYNLNPDGSGTKVNEPLDDELFPKKKIPVVPGTPFKDPDITKEKKFAAQYTKEKSDYGQTLFKGTPVSQGSLATPSGEENLLAQFMSINGKPLPGAQGEMAKRSGAFVFMGTETVKGKTGSFQRDIYMYAKDASSGLVAQGPSKIKAYQKALGLPVSGVDDGNLTKLWNDAVGMAREYAAAGIKMSVQDLFNNMIKNEIAKRRGGGGGGGGGSQFIGEDDAEVAAIDYYRSMMQILGDISGLPQPGGRG